jgi:hypothetical protein
MDFDTLCVLYGDKTAEQRRFFWRNIVLRSCSKEEIILRRTLCESTIRDLVAIFSGGFQAEELDEWLRYNFFRRGLIDKGATVEMGRIFSKNER